MPSIFSEDASGAEKWAKNDHTFFLKHPVDRETVPIPSYPSTIEAVSEYLDREYW